MTPTQPLFNVDTTMDTTCQVCGAIRPAGHQTTTGCVADRDRDQYPRRPKGCLNTIDPTTTPFPEGF